MIKKKNIRCDRSEYPFAKISVSHQAANIRFSVVASQMIGYEYNRATLDFDTIREKITVIFSQKGEYSVHRVKNALMLNVTGLVSDLDIDTNRRYDVKCEKNKASFNYTKTPEKQSDNKIIDATTKYLTICENNNLVPTIEQLCTVIDINPDELEQLCIEKDGETLTEIGKLRQLIFAVWEELLCQGIHENTITWLLKKYSDYK